MSKEKYIVREKNPAAVALGRMAAAKAGVNGMAQRGRLGAHARAVALSPERRSEIARKAVEARWAKAQHEAEAAEGADKQAREIAVELYGDPYADLDGVASPTPGKNKTKGGRSR